MQPINSFHQLGALQGIQGQYAPPAATEPANEMERIIGRLKATQAQTALLRDRLERVIARAFGEGQPAGAASTKPVAAGSIGAIQSLLDEIGTDLDGATSAISRLDNLA